MRYRQATYDDARCIATLHAHSWRSAYRGALRDEFLDGGIDEDRRNVWEARLAAPAPNQLVIVAHENERVVGFACAYGSADAEWGTLLDNLHVRREGQRRGTGRRLMSEVAAWCSAHHASRGLYLWGLEQNEPARRFYERLGAVDRGGDIWVPPGGGEVRQRRYVWCRHDLDTLKGK